jgi:hypothetical protein
VAANIAELAVALKAKGAEDIQRALQKVRDEGVRAGRETSRATNDVGSRYAAAARQVSFFTEQMARSGQVGGEALRGIASAGADMALQFGAGGVVGGALITFGLAMIEHFTRVRRQIAETADKAVAEGRRIARAVALGQAGDLSQEAALRYSGTDLRAQGLGQYAGRFDAGDGTMVRPVQELQRLIAAQRAKQAEDQQALDTIIPRADALTKAGDLTRAQLVLDSQPKLEAALATEKKSITDLTAELTKATAAWQQYNEATTAASTNAAAATERDRQADIKRAGEITAKKTVVIGTPYYGSSNPAETGRLTDLAPVPGVGDLKQTRVGSVDLGGFNAVWSAIHGQAADMAEQSKLVAAQITSTFADALADGFRRAFESGSIGAGIAALTGDILSGFGGMLVEVGKKGLIAAGLIDNIAKAITSWIPGGGIAASLALIAFGGALQGLGGAHHGSGGGGYGGGYYGPGYSGAGSSGYTPSAIARGANVTPRNPVIVNATIIGKDDPVAQREIVALINNATRRGL